MVINCDYRVQKDCHLRFVKVEQRYGHPYGAQHEQ